VRLGLALTVRTKACTTQAPEKVTGAGKIFLCSNFEEELGDSASSLKPRWGYALAAVADLLVSVQLGWRRRRGGTVSTTLTPDRYRSKDLDYLQAVAHFATSFR
jgi:hypothetical protein